MLQEIFLSTPEQTPVFSQTQIDFLVPQIVEAFTQATSEEHIAFQVAGDGDGTSPVSGTVTVFPPKVFFLTLKNSGSYTRNSSKLGSSSRQLLSQTTLLYSEEQAVLLQEDAKRLRNISSKDPWIAINYAALKSIRGKKRLGRGDDTYHALIPSSIHSKQTRDAHPSETIAGFAKHC